jgi:hypothetical protein
MATKNGLELFLFDYRNPKNQGKRWTLSVDELTKIIENDDIVIRPSRKQSERGLFDIGPKKRWYYSTHLFSTPEELQNKIYGLIDRAITLASDNN